MITVLGAGQDRQRHRLPLMSTILSLGTLTSVSSYIVIPGVYTALAAEFRAPKNVRFLRRNWLAILGENPVLRNVLMIVL
jgi:hypothetical protein